MSSDLGKEDEVIKEAEVPEEKIKSGRPFNYDDILVHIGEMGKFQLIIIICLCVPALFPGIVTYSYQFVGHVSPYRLF